MRPTSRLSHLVFVRGRAVGLTLAVCLMASAGAMAQAPAAAALPPAVPLSAYVPGENVVLYLEVQGLDAHADAWKKSSTYKILNETPTGAMLEEVLAQYLAQTTIKTSKAKITGTETVTLMKHVINNGFVVGISGTAGGPTNVIVLRSVFKSKEMKGIVGRFLGSGLDLKVKAKLVDVNGHKVVVQKNATGNFCAWWVDDARKEDLIYIPPQATEAAVVGGATRVLDTLDGKTPNASNNPKRTALLKEEDGFTPVAIAFLDLAPLPPTSGLKKFPPALGLDKVKDLDIRIGFQDKDLVSIVHVTAPKPREGLFALLDQPKFEKNNLPPIPDGVTGFSVLAFDPKFMYDQLTGLAKTLNPQAGEQIDAIAAQVKAKTRLRLKEDILSHFGPKMAIYVAPSKASGDGAKPAFSPLTMLTGGVEIPRLTIVIDIDDPVAFGRVLDELIIQANRALRSAIPAPPAEADDPRGRTTGGAGVEFKMVPGATKVYMLSYPPAMAAFIPSYIKPTIRVGPKHVVISISPDTARAALEVKGGGAATTTYAAALQPAPANLIFANVNDVTDTLSKALSTFPSALQAKINAANAPPAGLAAGGPNGPGGPGMPGMPGMPGSSSYPGGSSGPGSSSVPNSSSAGGGSVPGSSSSSRDSASRQPGSSYPGGSSGSGGSGGSSSGPGGQGGAGGAAESTGIVFNIDPAKIPTAAAIKPFLTPSLTTVSVDDDGIKLITRQAFPDLTSMVSNDMLSSILSKVRGAGGPPPGMAGGVPGAAPAGQPTIAPPVSPGSSAPAGPGQSPSVPGSSSRKGGRPAGK